MNHRSHVTVAVCSVCPLLVLLAGCPIPASTTTPSAPTGTLTPVSGSPFPAGPSSHYPCLARCRSPGGAFVLGQLFCERRACECVHDRLRRSLGRGRICLRPYWYLWCFSGSRGSHRGSVRRTPLDYSREPGYRRPHNRLERFALGGGFWNADRGNFGALTAIRHSLTRRELTFTLPPGMPVRWSLLTFDWNPRTHQLVPDGNVFFFYGDGYGGKHLFVSNNGSSNVAAFTINSDGTLSGVSGSPFSTGTGTNPRGIAVDRSGKFLYVANYSTDNVAAFAINSDGSLAAVSGSPFPAGSEPYSLSTDPKGRFRLCRGPW